MKSFEISLNRAYLLRDFEFLSGHNTILKMFSIIPFVEGCEQEKETLIGVTHVSEGTEFVKELVF